MNAVNVPAPLVIVAIHEDAPYVKTFTLAAKDGIMPPYKAGQFLTFSFLSGTKEERRSYSVSGSLQHGDLLAITVKRVENGAFSRWLIDKARVGDILQSTGIAGLFNLPETITDDNLLFFAAGIGITPVYALLKELLVTTISTKATLIYSNRNEEEAVFRKELLDLERASDGRLTIEWVFSNNKQLIRARLTRFLMEELLRKYMQDPLNTRCYICGPGDYRWLVQLLLEEAGVPLKNIRQEIFITERNLVLQAPPDKDRHRVTICIGASVYVLDVQYPDTILMAAKKAGIPMPYSCEAGRCSSCAARCTDGKVWIAYNEVLTERELQQGFILTCTGYAVGGDVAITL